MLKYTGAIVKYQSLFLPNNAAGLKNWNNESNDDENESENGNTTGPGKNLLLDTVRVMLHCTPIVEGDRGGGSVGERSRVVREAGEQGQEVGVSRWRVAEEIGENYAMLWKIVQSKEVQRGSSQQK